MVLTDDAYAAAAAVALLMNAKIIATVRAGERVNDGKKRARAWRRARERASERERTLDLNEGWMDIWMPTE